MPSDDRTMNSPQSVTRVIRIVEALCATAKPVSLAQLSRVLDAPKSSLAALLRGLADADFVVSSDNVYRLGPAAFGLGSALLEARRRLQSPDLVREGMRRLADQTGETVLFAVRDQDAVTLTYVDVIESRNTLRFAVSIGDRRPLYCTAGGRALLAAAPDSELRRYLRGLKPQQLTGRTETEKRKLAALIADAQTSGIAQTIDQASDGVSGSASVVHDAAGTALGALVVAAPSSRFDSRRKELADLVRAEAVAISATLGYRKPRS